MDALDTIKADISEVRSYLYTLQRSGIAVPTPVLGAIDRILSNHDDMHGYLDSALGALKTRLCGYKGQ